MPQAKQVLTYQFDELDEHAKEKARDWYRSFAFDFDWWSCTFEDAKECFKLAGFAIDKIYFNGFSSQGDGACFEGSWRAGDVKPGALKEHAPQDEELHRIAAEMESIAARYPHASMHVKHRGHYSHEMCTDFSVSVCDEDGNEFDADEVHEQIIEASRDAMRWIYRTLEKEFEYQNADAQVDEMIRANEYDFTEDGRRYRY